MLLICRAIFVLLVLSLQPTWGQLSCTVTPLNPPGAFRSYGQATNGSQQGGIINTLSATLWSGSAESFVDLTPAGANGGTISGMSDSQQVGTVSFPGNQNQAALWTGTAASFVNLNPTGATQSTAYATNGSQQAGIANVGGAWHGALWSGTAASFVDLHPVGYSTSIVWALNGSQQGGTLDYNTANAHAALWSGTAGSVVDLNPAGFSRSEIHTMTATRQGGEIGSTPNAALWSGTAASFVNLNPSGASSSSIWAMAGSYQLGYSTISGASHGALWEGTAGSFVDLHSIIDAGLGGGYTSSVIRGAYTDGTSLFLVGAATATSMEDSASAFLMTAPIPEPSTYAASIGVLVLGIASCRRLRRTSKQHG